MIQCKSSYDYATFDSLTVMPKFQSNRGSQNTNNEIQTTKYKHQNTNIIIHSNHNAKSKIIFTHICNEKSRKQNGNTLINYNISISENCQSYV